jgi:hypothetical protein
MIALDLSCGYNSRTVIYVTHDREHYRLTHCPSTGEHEMRAVSKVILFGKATHDKKVHQWPVAIFAGIPDARAYATFLRLAYRAKDDESIAALDKSHAQDATGKPLYDTKWAMVTVPYAPAPAFADDDATTSEGAPTT